MAYQVNGNSYLDIVYKGEPLHFLRYYYSKCMCRECFQGNVHLHSRFLIASHRSVRIINTIDV